MSQCVPIIPQIPFWRNSEISANYPSRATYERKKEVMDLADACYDVPGAAEVITPKLGSTAAKFLVV